MEYDIHTILDGLTLAATVWVIYELRGPLKGTYQADQDIVQTWMVVSIASAFCISCLWHASAIAEGFQSRYGRSNLQIKAISMPQLCHKHLSILQLQCLCRSA